MIVEQSLEYSAFSRVGVGRPASLNQCAQALERVLSTKNRLETLELELCLLYTSDAADE